MVLESFLSSKCFRSAHTEPGALNECPAHLRRGAVASGVHADSGLGFVPRFVAISPPFGLPSVNILYLSFQRLWQKVNEGNMISQIAHFLMFQICYPFPQILKMTLHCYLGFYLDSTLEMPFAVAAEFTAAMGTHMSSPERTPGTHAVVRPVCLFRDLLSVLDVQRPSATQGLCISTPLLQGSSLDLHRAAAPPHPSTARTQTLPPVTSRYSPLLPLCCWCLFW